MIRSALAFLMLSVWTFQAQGYKSTHLRQFNLAQCHENGCVQAEGDLAFMSMTKDLLTASRVTIEVQQSGKNETQSYFCQSFRLHMSTQFVTCDNSDSKTDPDLTIDSKFNISIFPKGNRKTEI